MRVGIAEALVEGDAVLDDNVAGVDTIDVVGS